MKKNIVRFPAFGILIVTLLATLNAQVARVRAQNIFVGDASGAYMVVKFDASGNETTFAPINWGGSSWDQPAGLALDNGGNLYVAYFGGGTNFVKKFDANGNATIFTFLNSTFAPEGILFDSHTNLYVANTYNGTIEKFSASGADLGTFGNVTMQWPDALAFDSKGNLYVSDLFGEKIYKFNASGQGTVFVSGDYYRGLAFDRSDNLYVGVGWSIDKFDTNGASLGNLGMRAGEFAAEGMMFDNFGNLFIHHFSDFLWLKVIVN